jgi:endonuclease G
MGGILNRFALIAWLALAAATGTRAAGGDEHLVMGNPSGATADESKKDNYLIQRKQYALSYHNAKGIPNWVSWHLNKGWLGKGPGLPALRRRAAGRRSENLQGTRAASAACPEGRQRAEPVPKGLRTPGPGRATGAAAGVKP